MNASSDASASPAAAPSANKGYIEVRVGRLPGKIETIGLDGERNVKAALEGAKLSERGYQIRVNNSPADLDASLKEGDIVILCKNVRGS